MDMKLNDFIVQSWDHEWRWHVCVLLSDEYNVFYWVYPDFPMEHDSYPCNVVAAKKEALLDFGVYPLSKESEYINLINYHLTHIQEKGWETEYFDHQEENSKTCDGEGDSQFTVVKYEGVITVFVVFGIGCIAAGINLLLEAVYKRLKKI